MNASLSNTLSNRQIGRLAKLSEILSETDSFLHVFRDIEPAASNAEELISIRLTPRRFNELAIEARDGYRAVLRALIHLADATLDAHPNAEEVALRRLAQAQNAATAAEMTMIRGHDEEVAEDADCFATTGGNIRALVNATAGQLPKKLRRRAWNCAGACLGMATRLRAGHGVRADDFATLVCVTDDVFDRITKKLERLHFPAAGRDAELAKWTTRVGKNLITLADHVRSGRLRWHARKLGSALVKLAEDLADGNLSARDDLEKLIEEVHDLIDAIAQELKNTGG